MSLSTTYKNRRQAYQDIGRARIKEESPLYVAGCMLYWGEGHKDKNSVRLTNSDAALVVLFKKFLTTYFDVKDDDFVFSINCYTDLHPLEEIENYWFTTLGLSKNNLRKGQTNNVPKSSKKSKAGKCEWGTIVLMVHKTQIVQELYGAIQEYGSFENKDWLK